MLLRLGSVELLFELLTYLENLEERSSQELVLSLCLGEDSAYNSADYYKLLQFKDNGNLEDLERRSILAIIPHKEPQVLFIYCGSCI